MKKIDVTNDSNLSDATKKRTQQIKLLTHSWIPINYSWAHVTSPMCRETQHVSFPVFEHVLSNTVCA